MQTTSAQPIPSWASRVFSGLIFDVYQWEQTQFDGSVRTFEKVRRPDTAYVLPIMGSTIVTIRETQPGCRPSHGLVGGRVEPNELPAAAAARELWEELGIEAKRLELWTSFQPLRKVEWSVHIFVARGSFSSSGTGKSGGEAIEPVYQSLDEFIEGLVQDSFGNPEVALFVLRLERSTGRDSIRDFLLHPPSPSVAAH